MRKPIFLFCLCFIFAPKIFSQIAGSFTVPGSFPSIAAAINTLNLTGVAGAVTINVLANHTETVPVGGLKLINPPGSSTTTILFKKQGLGNNPILYAYSGGTASSTSDQRDGIWMLVSCKNITIDAIDLFDPNTTSPEGMEFGYGFYKTFFVGSNHNNTIRNCVITLSPGASDKSHGIDVTIKDYQLNQTNIIPSSTIDVNSNNSVYSNLIQKCDIGIWMRGYNSAFPNYGNDIGGLSSVTGNTIINFGGYNGAATGVEATNEFQLNCSFNIFNNNNGFGNNAISAIYGIYSSGVDANINNNTISLSIGSSGPLVGIFHDGYLAGTGTLNINNNVFPVLNNGSSSSTSHSVIASVGGFLKNINNNQITNFTSNTGTVSLISAVDGSTANINNNTVSGASITVQGQVQGIFSSSNYQNILNNTIGNFMAPGNSTLTSNRAYGINSPKTWATTVANNTVTNIYCSNIYGIYLTSTISSTSYSVSNNVVTNFAAPPSSTVGSASYGILTSLSSTNSGGSTIRNNVVSNLTGSKLGNSNMGGEVRGITCGNGVNGFVYQNKIYNLSSNGTYGVYGIWMTSAQRYIYNNLVGGLDISSTGNVSALNLNTDGTSRVYFNTLYLNAISSTNSTGTSLISSVNNSVIELRNNILVNTTSITGIPSIITTNNILSTSNNNSFYFGTTGRILATAPSSSVLSGFQSIFNSDSQSFIEHPNFVSTVGSNPNFLNINTSIPTQIESGAAAISTITTDFINAVRSSTPDVGAWEGNFIAADASPPVILSSGFTDPPCSNSTRTFTANLIDVSGVATGSLAPRVYHRVNFGLYTSTQGVLTSGTPTNGVWTFTLNYSANINDVIWYFLVAQDVSYLNNLILTPANSATITDVNNVIVPPNPALNYTIQTFPTISLTVNSGTICQGQSFIIQASGASLYSFTPGNSATVTPLFNTNYTVSGASSMGCPSTNTLSFNLSVLPSPTVSVISSSSLICVGQTATLNASGANSYTWNPGGTSSSIIVNPVITTTYVVTGIGNNNCLSSSTFIQAVSPCTNVDFKFQANGPLEIYPNPFTNNLIININEVHDENYVLEVYNSLGAILFSTKIVERKTEIILSEQGAGVFFIRVSSNKCSIIKKIIKE